MVPLVQFSMLTQTLQQLVELRALHDVAVNGDVWLSLQRKGVKEALIQIPVTSPTAWLCSPRAGRYL